jgi:hypothetical protein
LPPSRVHRGFDYPHGHAAVRHESLAHWRSAGVYFLTFSYLPPGVRTTT